MLHDSGARAAQVAASEPHLSRALRHARGREAGLAAAAAWRRSLDTRLLAPAAELLGIAVNHKETTHEERAVAAQCWLALADVHLASGSYRGALESLQRVIVDFPDAHGLNMPAVLATAAAIETRTRSHSAAQVHWLYLIKNHAPLGMSEVDLLINLAMAYGKEAQSLRRIALAADASEQAKKSARTAHEQAEEAWAAAFDAAAVEDGAERPVFELGVSAGEAARARAERARRQRNATGEAKPRGGSNADLDALSSTPRSDVSEVDGWRAWKHDAAGLCNRALRYSNFGLHTLASDAFTEALRILLHRRREHDLVEKIDPQTCAAAVASAILAGDEAHASQWGEFLLRSVPEASFLSSNSGDNAISFLLRRCPSPVVQSSLQWATSARLLLQMSRWRSRARAGLLKRRQEHAARVLTKSLRGYASRRVFRLCIVLKRAARRFLGKKRRRRLQERDRCAAVCLQSCWRRQLAYRAAATRRYTLRMQFRNRVRGAIVCAQSFLRMVSPRIRFVRMRRAAVRLQSAFRQTIARVVLHTLRLKQKRIRFLVQSYDWLRIGCHAIPTTLVRGLIRPTASEMLRRSSSSPRRVDAAGRAALVGNVSDAATAALESVYMHKRSVETPAKAQPSRASPRRKIARQASFGGTILVDEEVTPPPKHPMWKKAQQAALVLADMEMQGVVDVIEAQRIRDRDERVKHMLAKSAGKTSRVEAKARRAIVAGVQPAEEDARDLVERAGIFAAGNAEDVLAAVDRAVRKSVVVDASRGMVEAAAAVEHLDISSAELPAPGGPRGRKQRPRTAPTGAQRRRRPEATPSAINSLSYSASRQRAMVTRAERSGRMRPRSAAATASRASSAAGSAVHHRGMARSSSAVATPEVQVQQLGHRTGVHAARRERLTRRPATAAAGFRSASGLRQAQQGGSQRPLRRVASAAPARRRSRLSGKQPQQAAAVAGTRPGMRRRPAHTGRSEAWTASAKQSRDFGTGLPSRLLAPTLAFDGTSRSREELVRSGSGWQRVSAATGRSAAGDSHSRPQTAPAATKRANRAPDASKSSVPTLLDRIVGSAWVSATCEPMLDWTKQLAVAARRIAWEVLRLAKVAPAQWRGRTAAALLSLTQDGTAAHHRDCVSATCTWVEHISVLRAAATDPAVTANALAEAIRAATERWTSCWKTGASHDQTVTSSLQSPGPAKHAAAEDGSGGSDVRVDGLSEYEWRCAHRALLGGVADWSFADSSSRRTAYERRFVFHLALRNYSEAGRLLRFCRKHPSVRLGTSTLMEALQRCGDEEFARRIKKSGSREKRRGRSTAALMRSLRGAAKGLIVGGVIRSLDRRRGEERAAVVARHHGQLGRSEQREYDKLHRDFDALLEDSDEDEAEAVREAQMRFAHQAQSDGNAWQGDGDSATQRALRRARLHGFYESSSSSSDDSAHEDTTDEETVPTAGHNDGGGGSATHASTPAVKERTLSLVGPLHADDTAGSVCEAIVCALVEDGTPKTATILNRVIAVSADRTCRDQWQATLGRLERLRACGLPVDRETHELIKRLCHEAPSSDRESIYQRLTDLGLPLHIVVAATEKETHLTPQQSAALLSSATLNEDDGSGPANVYRQATLPRGSALQAARRGALRSSG